MTHSYPRVFLKAKKENVLRRLHPWVFSGAIAKMERPLEDGEIVWVANSKGEVLATGLFHHGSIAVRILTFAQAEIDTAFWEARLQSAKRARSIINLPNPQTNAYRLIHAEGDQCPGLIIDIYNGVAVFQAHAIGMHKLRMQIVEALRKVLGTQLTAIYDKSRATLPNDYAAELQDSYLWGTAPSIPHIVNEYGHRFAINWETGQKTGFFLDQRENRRLLQNFVANKRVLNAFCYSGGFSVYAAAAGATEVDSVDASAKAIALTEENMQLGNFSEEATFSAYTDDVLTFLKGQEKPYDVMVLDPPAYAKSLKKRHRAVQGYKRLNIAGLQKLAKGGILFTFSCSQVVDAQLFYNTIASAAMEVGRSVRVLHQLSQPGDHPINIFHPESSYLKGLVLQVD